ncbi:unnamed protein product [Bathycoccus prasinos]
MSFVSSSPSSAASPFPTTTTTTTTNNDGKASEEKVEKDVLSELEQRVTSVEETILVSSLASASSASSSSKQSLSSTLLFAKLASLRSAFVDSHARFIAAKTSKENEIKRLHDRLEKVLFQIAVVGVLKREDEKNGYQNVPFGRSARAIARDCLVLTFSFGNRQSVFRFANERLNDIDDFPKRKSAFQGVVGENAWEKMERFYGACDCLEALIWSFGKELGTGQFCDSACASAMKAVDNRAYKDDISGIKVATVALKVAARCVGNPDAVSDGGLKLTAKTIDHMRRMIKRVVALEGGRRASTEISRATQEAKRRALELRAAMFMAMKKSDANSIKLEIEAFNGRGDSNNVYSAGYHALGEIEQYGKGKNVLNLIAETQNLGNSGVEVISAFATVASQVERKIGTTASVGIRGSSSQLTQSTEEEGVVDDIGDDDDTMGGEFADEDRALSTSSSSSSLYTVKTCFIKPLFETSEVTTFKDSRAIQDAVARAWMRYATNPQFSGKSYSVEECTRDIVKVGFASKLRKNDCFAAACGLAVLRVAAFEKRVDESTRKATLKQILDILRCQIVSTADEKLKNAKQKRRGKLIDDTNDLRIVSILRAVRDGIDAIGYVDAESFLYIKNVFSSKHGDALFRTKWRVNERAGALAKAALSAGHEMATRELARTLSKMEMFVKFDDELIADARFICALIGEKTASWPLGVPIDAIDRVEEVGARLCMLNASAKAREAGFICLSASSLARSSIFIYSQRRDEEKRKKFENIAFVISSTFDEVASTMQTSSEEEETTSRDDLAAACAAAEAVEAYARFASAEEENGRATKLMLGSLLCACERIQLRDAQISIENIEIVRRKLLLHLRAMSAYASCSKDVEKACRFQDFTPQISNLIANFEAFAKEVREDDKNVLFNQDEEELVYDDDDTDRLDFGRLTSLSSFLDEAERELLVNTHVVTLENGDETVSQAFADLRAYRGNSNAPPNSPSHVFDDSKESDNIVRKDVFPFAATIVDQIDEASRACFSRAVEVAIADGGRDAKLQAALGQLLYAWEERCIQVIEHSKMLVNLNSSEYRKKHVSLFNHPKKPALTDFLRCDAAVSRRFADILSVSHMLREDTNETSQLHLKMFSRYSRALRNALSTHAPLESALLCAKCIEQTASSEEVRERAYNLFETYSRDMDMQDTGHNRRTWNSAIECLSLSKSIEHIGAMSIGETTLRRLIEALSKISLNIDPTHRSTHAFAIRALANVAEVCGSRFARDSDRAVDLSMHMLDSLPAQEALLKNVVSFVPECGHLANAAAIAIGPDLSAEHKVFIKAMNVAAIIRDVQSHSRFQNFRLALDNRNGKGGGGGKRNPNSQQELRQQYPTLSATSKNDDVEDNFNESDDVVYAEVVFIQHMAMFAPNAIDMMTVAITLRDALRHYATKPVALETLSFLAMKDARKLLYPDDDEYASKSTKSSSKFGSMLLRDIVKCVTKGASRRVIRDAKNCARVLARDLSIRDPKRALKALSALSFDDQRLVEESEDEESEDDEDAFNDDEDEDEENEEGEMDEEEIDESDIDANRANNHPRLPARIFAASLLSRIPFWIQESNIPEHRSVKLSRASDSPNAYLPTHGQRCFQIAYSLSTASASKLRARGLQMMSFLVKLWGNDEDPDAFYHIDDDDSDEDGGDGFHQRNIPSARNKKRSIKTLEQFQAQILSAVRASRSSDTPLDVRVAGARLAAHALSAKVHGSDDSVSKRLHACIVDFAKEWLPVYPKASSSAASSASSSSLNNLTSTNACCEAVMVRARIAACMCLATAYICNEEDSTSIPSDVVEAFVPAWTYLPHDVELIKRSVELREGSEKQMLDNMIMDKFELLPGELVTACPSLVQDVAEAFLPCVKASVRASDTQQWSTLREHYLKPILLASLDEPFAACTRTLSDQSSDAIERFNPTPDAKEVDAACIPLSFMFNARTNDVEQVETALRGLKTFENAHSFAESAAQSLLNDKLGKAAFDCAKSSEAYRKIRDAAIEFLNSSSSAAVPFNGKASPNKVSITTTSGFTDENLLMDLIEDDVVEASISYEKKEKKFIALANLLAQMEKVNRKKFEEILVERLESEESISTNLNSALVALMALDVYLDSKSSASEEDVVVLRKLAPSIAVFSRQTAKGENSESMNRVDADLNVLFVSSTLKFLKNAAEKDAKNLSANILAAMFAIAIETLGSSNVTGKKMALDASRLSNAAVREQPLAARGAVSGMISSTRVQFKALLDYSSGVVDDCDDGDDDVEERKPGKISLRAFQ